MFTRYTRAGLFAALLLGIVACTAKPVLNIEKRTPATAARSEDDMRQALLMALQRRQWLVERAERGLLMARLQRRSHQAEITIPYSASGYSILYRDSHNLDHEDGKIHRNYNRWIHNLDSSIQQELHTPSPYPHP